MLNLSTASFRPRLIITMTDTSRNWGRSRGGRNHSHPSTSAHQFGGIDRRQGGRHFFDGIWCALASFPPDCWAEPISTGCSRPDDAAQVLGIKPRRQRRRTHQVAKHDRELAALGVVTPSWLAVTATGTSPRSRIARSIFSLSPSATLRQPKPFGVFLTQSRLSIGTGSGGFLRATAAVNGGAF